MASEIENPGPVETLARLALQSIRYGDDAEFRDAVDAVFNKPIYDAAPELRAMLKRMVDHHASHINDLPGAYGVSDLEAATDLLARTSNGG